MARPAVFINNIAYQMTRIRAALLTQYPDAELPVFEVRSRHGELHVISTNLENLADFLTAQVVENSPLEEVPAGTMPFEDEGSYAAMTRQALINLAQERGLKVIPTGSNSYVTREDALRALNGATDDAAPTDNSQEDIEVGGVVYDTPTVGDSQEAVE